MYSIVNLSNFGSRFLNNIFSKGLKYLSPPPLSHTHTFSLFVSLIKVVCCTYFLKIYKIPREGVFLLFITLSSLYYTSSIHPFIHFICHSSHLLMTASGPLHRYFFLFPRLPEMNVITWPFQEVLWKTTSSKSITLA